MALACGCGDSAGEDKNAGTAGAAGGGAGVGGTAGAGATAGVAGSASGGSSGAGATGGVAGGGGGGGGTAATGACPAAGCGCTHYVATDGTASNDGLTPASPWSISHAFSSATAGDVVCIAAGNYGKVALSVKQSGTADKPIRFFGYRSTPGDVVSAAGRSTFKRGDSIDATAMPLLDGGDGTGTALSINAKPYIDVVNLQITRFSIGVTVSADNVRLENVIAVALGDQLTKAPYDGFGIRLSGKHGVITRCFVQDANAEAIKVYGGDNVAITFSDVYASNPKNPMDYYFLFTGDTKNSVIEDSVGYRELGLEHGGHGFDMKDLASYNTVRRCRAVHTSFELNFSGVHHNTYEDSEVVGVDTSPSQWHANIGIGNGAHHNLFRNIWVHDVWSAISFFDHDDGYVGPGGDRDEVATGSDNTFVNIVVTNADRVINIGGGPEYAAPAERNHFYNSTFHNVGQLAVTYYKNSDTRFINCVVDQVKQGKLWGEGGAPYIHSKFDVTFDHCNFSNNSFAPPSGTAITTLVPGFADPTKDDFSLLPSSALIDKGTDTTHKYDFAGTVRPQGAKFDLGAFERSGN